MKFSDGIFHQVFSEIAYEYPAISNPISSDIGTARLATKPEIFDVIVTLTFLVILFLMLQLEISGSVGLKGSANIGRFCFIWKQFMGQHLI